MHPIFNVKPAPYDPQDEAYRYAMVGAPRPDLLLPPGGIGKPFDQARENSCTGNTWARYMRVLFPGFNPSRNFIYDGERLIEKMRLTQDQGAYGHDGAKFLRKVGCCSEELLPYTRATMTHKPPQACYDEAAKYRIGTYRHLHTLDEILDCLAAGGLIAYGFTVFSSFDSPEVAKTGVLNMPQPGEKEEGGHEVLMCGVDMKKRRVISANSWGDWGMTLTCRDGVEQDGFFTTPFEYITNRKLAFDFITVTL